MDMGSSSTAMAMSSATSSMNMASSTSMNMGSSTMSMDMSSSSSTADSMDMDMDMSMNSYLTTHYNGYPVVFKTLTASSGGAAFGIFCALFFTAFAFRGLTFLSAYVEQKVFRDIKPFDLSENETPVNSQKTDVHESSRSTDVESDINRKKHLKERSAIAKFFAVTPTSLYRDFIRLIIAFVAAMFGYAIMLAAMSFVILYFFAIVLGLAFGEVFFFRLALVMEINQSNSICESLH